MPVKTIECKNLNAPVQKASCPGAKLVLALEKKPQGSLNSQLDAGSFPQRLNLCQHVFTVADAIIDSCYCITCPHLLRLALGSIPLRDQAWLPDVIDDEVPWVIIRTH